MNEELRETLVATGVIDPCEVVEAESVVEGVTCVTTTVRTASGWVWIEREYGAENRGRALAERLELCQRVLAPDPGLAVLPRVAPDGSLVYAGLPGGELLSDLILARGADESVLLARVRALGSWATRLHRRGVRHARRRWRRVPPPPWLVEQVEALCDRASGRLVLHAELERMQELLLLDHGGLRDELSASCAALEQPGCGATVVHGELTPGYVICGPRSPGVRVIGFHRAALGPPEYDVGCFLGELAELGRAEDRGDGLAPALGRAFIDAYCAASGFAAADLLAAAAPFAALKVVAHLVRYVRAFGFDRSLVRTQLQLAEDLITEGSARWV